MTSHASNPRMTLSAWYNGSRQELPVLPSQTTPDSTIPRSKSRSRLRSLSNASKNFINKFRSKQEEAPAVPSLPPSARAVDRRTHGVIVPPPPYTVAVPAHGKPYTIINGDHTRANSSSSSASSSSRLRERCHVQLTVSTEKTIGRDQEKRRFTVDLNDQLRKLANIRSQGPRASLLSPIRISFPSTSPTTRTSSLSHLHEVLPYLSVAYCDSQANIPPKRFTHIVKVIYLGDENHFVETGGQSWRLGHAHHLVDRDNNCQVLYLAVPPPSYVDTGRKTGTHASSSRDSLDTTTTSSSSNNNTSEEGRCTRLTQDQLIYARDFLSLALPYYAEAHPEAVFQRGLEDGETRSADRVRVLICAPRTYECHPSDKQLPSHLYPCEDGDEETEDMLLLDSEAGATDIVSLAASYLAYATGIPVHRMLEHFNDDPSVPVAFKDAVCDASYSAGKQGLQFVEDVSRNESSVFPCGN